MHRHLLLAVVLALPGTAAVSRAAEPDLAQKGYEFLQKHCYQCHGIGQEGSPTLDMKKRDSLLGKSENYDKTNLTPGKPDESLVWEFVSTNKMPPKRKVQNRPTDEEKETLKAWIAAGAPFPQPKAETRPFKSEKDVLNELLTDLRKTAAQDIKFQRYFTLTHLANNRTVTEPELRLYRAALSKLVNSLSSMRDIVVPKAVDKEQTIFKIDLRQLGWHKQGDRPDLWREILKAYPYGLKHDEDRDPALQELAREVYRLAGSDLPYLRADWFIAAASRPPLYHTMLQAPATATELEKKLGVNVRDNFLNDTLLRAGFMSSLVSRHNRLLERHTPLQGSAYYWKSYDFSTSGGRGNLLRFPLGPTFKDHPFTQQAFQHAGGEIIWSLPNGLQGYLLVDSADKRIDRGPIDIVRDTNETSGTPEVVNGLSCMSCHKHGINPFKDTIRNASGVFGDARKKVQTLHPEAERLNQVLQKDRKTFLDALKEAAGPFLLAGEDKNKDFELFDDPVGAAAKRYLVSDLTLEDVACELGVGDAQKLKNSIETNPKLKELGLGPLLEGEKIKREVWDFQQGGSLYQAVASELDLGSPLKVN